MKEKILFKKWYFIDRGEGRFYLILIILALVSFGFLSVFPLFMILNPAGSNPFPLWMDVLSFSLGIFFLIGFFPIFPRMMCITRKEIQFFDNNYYTLMSLLMYGSTSKKILLKNIKKFWIDRMCIWIITVDKKEYEINTQNFNKKELIQLAKIFRGQKITVLDKYLKDIT